jgi:hypothetical protein
MPTALADVSVSYFSRSNSKGQFETLEPHPSHRKLIEFLIVVVVVGGAFLYLWQAVLQFSFGPQEFNEEGCVRILKQYQSDLEVDSFVEATAPGAEVQRLDASFYGDESRLFSIEKAGGRVRSCSVTIATNSQLGGYGDPFTCDIITLRYRNEEASNYLLVATQAEFPEEIALAGIPRYSYSIIYFNPDARSSYDAALSQLRQHTCVQGEG